MSIPVPPAPDEQSKEPALTVGAITAAVTAVLALVTEFVVPLTDKQQAVILGAAVVLVPIAQAVWTRRKVWSPAKVADLFHGQDRLR